MYLVNDLIETSFFIALVVNSFLFIPQIITLCRLKHSEDVSIITFVGFSFALLFATSHALLHHDWLFFIGAGLSLISCSVVSILAIYYRLKRL